MVAAGALVVAIVLQVINAIAPAIIAATRMFAMTRITMSTRFSFVVIFSKAPVKLRSYLGEIRVKFG